MRGSCKATRRCRNFPTRSPGCRRSSRPSRRAAKAWPSSHASRRSCGARLADRPRGRRLERLILAGREEAATELRRLLPRALARRVAAVTPADIDAGVREILDKTLAVERRIEREDEERLVRQLADLAGPGGRSVLGVRPTLAALWADLVQTLVVAQGARGEGAECPNCDRLDPGRVE